MSTEASGEVGHGGLGASSGASDLAVRGAGEERSGHLDGEVASFEVVGEGKGLPGASAVTDEAAEPGNGTRIGGASIGAVAMEARSTGTVSQAVGPGAKRGSEVRRRDLLDRSARPVHGRA
jgi:hypothetical protein